MPAIPTIVFVGGFLGSGKTTLLVQAAALLRDSGMRAALITNDQGGALVDTRLAQAGGSRAEEVTGGCFCCRISELMAAADRLREFEPDVILAEPVGSCIDVSATVLQPIQQLYGDRYRLAPFTVLVDPQRAEELLSPEADPYLSYLFFNQIAEADLVCCNKADVAESFPELPTGYSMRLSARTGQGVREWLAEALAGGAAGGKRLLEVDYAYYAEAEAALGWLNWQADLALERALSPAQVVGPFLDDLEGRLTQAGIAIAHLKILANAATGTIKASLCRNGDEPAVDGDLTASPDTRHELLLNLRALGTPEALLSILRQASAILPGRIAERHLESFRPSPPKPEYRIGSVPQAECQLERESTV